MSLIFFMGMFLGRDFVDIFWGDEGVDYVVEFIGVFIVVVF